MSISGGSRIFRWGRRRPVGGRQPPTRMLFGENERIGSCWEGAPPGSANGYDNGMKRMLQAAEVKTADFGIILQTCNAVDLVMMFIPN